MWNPRRFHGNPTAQPEVCESQPDREKGDSSIFLTFGRGQTPPLHHPAYVGEGYPPSRLFLQKDEDTTCGAPVGVHQRKNVTCCWSERCDILIEQSQFCVDKTGPGTG